MLLAVVEIVVVACVVLYLGACRVQMSRRRTQTWEQLLGRLSARWSGARPSVHFPWKEGVDVPPDENWVRIGGLTGLWAMYRNAGVMVELADCAAKQMGIDSKLVEVLRTDAAQIRLGVLSLMFRWLFSAANERVRLNAFRIVSIYTGMAANLTAFLEEHNHTNLPAFVAAI